MQSILFPPFPKLPPFLCVVYSGVRYRRSQGLDYLPLVPVSRMNWSYKYKEDLLVDMILAVCFLASFLMRYPATAAVA